ncbi:MAG: type VI secretion system baseplate subunit TssE [Thermodesulfobacteriota bacterium]
MREERLLERIRTWKKEPLRRGKEEPRRVIDSVLRHLRRILNTKQGNVLIAEDYGVPDFSDFLNALPDSIRDIEKNIRAAIQKYEPRLTGVRVNFIPQEDDPLSLRFQITARLAMDAKTQVFIETIVDADGQVEIRG